MGTSDTDTENPEQIKGEHKGRRPPEGLLHSCLERKFIQRLSSAVCTELMKSLDNRRPTSPGRVAGLQQDWDSSDRVGCYTHNWNMVLDGYRLIRKEKGKQSHCAKEILHCVDLQYETGSEPLAPYHTRGKAQGRNTCGAEVGSVAISFRNQMDVLGTMLLHSSFPGDHAWRSLNKLLFSHPKPEVPTLPPTFHSSSGP